MYIMRLLMASCHREAYDGVSRARSTRLLVFCVLCDPSGITNPGVIHNFLEPGELIVNKIAHQLPLAVVTFDKLPNQGPCSIS